MIKRNNKIPLIIITGFGLFFIFLFYGKILSDPNNYMFTDSGDGLKNYFTYAYHIKHDSTYTNFEGMNYPYGENYLYTDCHPIISNSLKLLSSPGSFIETHSIGLLNLFMILSIFFTFIIVFLLLVELKLNAWFSIFFSIGITLLAPQIFRMSGHLALSYSFALPLSWLLLIKCIHKQRIYYYILLFVNLLFWMFIHAYLGIIIFSFLFSILILKILSDEQKKKFLKSYIWLTVSIILPIAIFYLYATFTDTHTGRTDNPSGFFLYNAEIDDILIPHEKPFKPVLNKLSKVEIKLQWEAWGYVGLVNSLFFIALLIIAIISSFNKKARSILKVIFESRTFNISLIAAFIVLLFAMAFPFKQFPELIELFPIFKQFRATGRFVWPFYFVFTAFAAYAFQKFLLPIIADNKKRISGIVMVLIICGISWLEGLFYHNNESKHISSYQNLFQEELLPDGFRMSIDQINPDDYQALISLPFYYYGSESYARPRNNDAVKNSLILSYHTGIPNVCANLTRTSIEESKRIIQIVSPNYYTKKIINDLKSNKAFLIIRTGNDLTKYESSILEKATLLYHSEQFDLLEISTEKLFSDDRRTILDDFKEKLAELKKQDSFYLADSSSILYYNSFEEIKSDTVYRGRGSFRSMKKAWNRFAEFPPYTFEKDKEYDISMWFYNNEQDALNLSFKLIVEEHDEINDRRYQTVFLPDQAEVINDSWSLVEGIFTVKDTKNRIYIISKGKENSKASLHADDLLIKEKGIDIYKFNNADSTMFYNNHKINLK